MELFHIPERRPEELLAVADGGRRVLYGELFAAGEGLARAGCRRELVFVLCENTAGTLLGYLGCLLCGAVALLLDAHIAPELLGGLAETYRPAFFLVPRDLPAQTRVRLPQAAPALELRESVLLSNGGRGPALHPELALLLATSGSTGSPKLVRLSGKNLQSNAGAIVEYLGLTPEERPITTLPMNYSYGMSVVNSHVQAGAAVLLTRRGVLERGFWDRAAGEGATSLAGVPYTYQMFRRLGLASMKLPRLRYLTQAGGGLPPELHREFAAWAAGTGRRFYVMYGQTEAGPRMGYLPPERAEEKCGAMGIAIPGGRFWLEDGDGRVADGPGASGELVYQGENVAMGYAETADGLRLGDEWGGVLRTGDMARRDDDGIYYITGRKKRFVKLYGSRVGLDGAERLLSARFPEAEFACVGRDGLLSVYVSPPGGGAAAGAADYLAAQTRLPRGAFRVCPVAAIPKTEAGKTCYARLNVDGLWDAAGKELENCGKIEPGAV